MNPFPGLRPFEPDEDHLFFGREKQIDELIRKLRTNRFLLVTGSSGSGKSSLVRSGLVPSLHSGSMAAAGSNWHVATMRPGEDPIGNLALALNKAGVGGAGSMLLETTLRRGALGLIEAVQQARIQPQDNVLVLVDQFEELFRFRRNSKDEAAAFVKLLLEASQQSAVPIYIVLTMRADFIGDCMSFLGLPEALNTGQYLVPRMTRDELRSAITGPVAVEGGQIAPRLVSRLLNDCGDDPDQLPVLQHALMRTWDYWSKERASQGVPIDLADYETIGTMRQALSLHAEEAYAEAAPAGQPLVERLFKALTDTSKEAKGVRLPASVAELTAICGTAEADLVSIVDIFRRPGRSFLMPPTDTPLEPGCIVDLSHESLMRGWTRLIKWAEEERASREAYWLLAQDAECFERGAVGLWRPPELDIGLRWRDENKPTAAWARRIAPDFERSMRFLEASAQERDRLAAERRQERKRKLALAWIVAAALAVLLMIMARMAFIANHERATAKAAVNSLLSSAGSQSGQTAPDTPEVAQLQKRLTERARQTYETILAQRAEGEFPEEIALVHMRLADGHRVTGETREAISEYKKAIEQLRADGNHRRELAEAYHWLGETERTLPELWEDAEKAYGLAVALEAEPATKARSHYSRGIVREARALFSEAEFDYRQAIGLLTSLGANESYKEDLARAKNNLAQLLFHAKLAGDARPLYEDAIQIGEHLVIEHKENRDYQFELAQYYDNFAIWLQFKEETKAALTNSGKAITIYQDLTRPAPAYSVHLGLMHDIRGRILDSSDLKQAEAEYRRSVETFGQVETNGQTGDYHLWFGQALANLANLLEETKRPREAIPPLLKAIQHHRTTSSSYDLAWDYYYLAKAYSGTGATAEAQSAYASLSAMIAKVPEADRQELKELLP